MKKVPHAAKKAISALLSAVMVSTSFPNTYIYADSPSEIRLYEPVTQSEPKPETLDKQLQIYTLKNKGKVSEYGYQDMVWVDEQGNESEGDNTIKKPDSGLSRSSVMQLPASYSMADEGLLPPVRNQGKWGTCWAHASICSLETNMIKKGLVDKSQVDYSERHLSYFAHKRNSALADGADKYDTQYGWYGGGNYRMSTFGLSGWYGAADESDFPYSAYGDMEDLEEGSRTASVCHLTDASVLTTSEEIKGAIIKNGSVICSYYSDDKSIDNRNHAVYQTQNLGTNHLVSIVGWDDGYSASNFSGSQNGDTPASDGAWLCRNSWGSSWGDNGYFWISYEDATLGWFCSFEAEAADNYDNIYQYDGAGYNCYIGYVKSANIFQSKSVEELKAVSFYAYGYYDYIIEIYVEKEGGMGSPSDGMMVYSQSGTLDAPGYHTIRLDESVVLEGGKKYAAAVQFISNDGSDVYSYAERGDDYSSEEGQSFMYTNAGKWADTSGFTNGIKNVCIKAFTDDVENADKSLLEPVIKQAESIIADDYTAASWNLLCTELENAKKIYNGQNPGISDVIRAKQSLESAISNLTPAKVYIGSEDEFVIFAKSVSAGMDYEGQTVYLTDNLDMSGKEYSAAGSISNPFMGTFDGGGHSINNLTYEYEYSYGGLFGFVGKNGIVKDINLHNADMRFGAAYSGGITAINEGRISGCSINGKLLFDCETSAIGGIAGENRGIIEKTSVNGTVTFENQKSSSYYVGGITGKNTGTMSWCFIEGEIISNGNASTGGIAGRSESESILKNCYNLAVISGNPTEETCAAGIGTVLYGETYGCYNYGDIKRPSSGNKNGAIYCYGKGNISNCYYLDAGGIKGGYSPSMALGAMSEEEFAEGKTSYYLNSNGGTGDNSYEWSLKGGVPISADGGNKAVIRVKVSQDPQNEYTASVNGITDGEFYAKGGTEIKVLGTGDIEKGYMISASCTGLMPSDNGGGIYILPDKDVSSIVTCIKECIEYSITYNLNGGNCTAPYQYNIEEEIKLPVPEKTNADFLGWYDNKDFTGDTVEGIPKGSIGDKAFWAKWYNYGFKVLFPQTAGIEIKSCEGYEDTGIQEGEPYLFMVEAQKGYDISGIQIRYGDVALVPEDGVYRIDNITSDIDNISITGIVLADSNYAMDGHIGYNGYVGRKAVITPVYPAVMLKAVGAVEFAQSIEADTAEPVRIILSDEYGNESSAVSVTFKRDITEPEIGSVETFFVDEQMKYKGIYIKVDADDSESGVSGYSFDGGATWQEDNRYHVLCEETETVFGKEILVRDSVGNVAKHNGTVTIPAIIKYPSSIGLKSDKKTYIYGSDILLTAEIAFEGDLTGNMADYGKVMFVTEQGHELGALDVVPSGSKKGIAQLTVPASVYGGAGEKVYMAVYDGAGTPYRNCQSEKCALEIEKAVVSSVDTVIQTSKSVSAVEKYTEQQIKALINIEQVEITANTGDKYSLDVTWSTSDRYNIKGGTYNFTGVIHGNDFVSVPEGMTLNTKVVVSPVVMQNPIFPDIKVEQRDIPAADFTELGSQILPDSGTVTVYGSDIKFSIAWNPQQNIDLTVIGNTVEFTGTVTYEDVPEYITLPESPDVTRRVVVVKSDNIGTVIRLVPDSENHVDGEDIIISASISAIGNMPVTPDSGNSYGMVYLYMCDEDGTEYLAGCEEADASLSVNMKVSRASEKYTGYGGIGTKTFYAVYEYGGRRQSLWSSTSEPVKVNILKKVSKPARPSSVTLRKKTKNSIEIKWGSVKSAAGYEVYCQNGTGPYKKCKTIKGGKNTSAIHKGLSRTGIYSYIIRAFVNGYGGKVYGTFTKSKSVKMGKSISSDELKLSASKVKLKVGKSKTVKVLYPKGRSKSEIKSIKYKSGSKRIAKVDSKGKITAIKKGTANITVTIKLKNSQTKKLKVKVTAIR